MARSMCPWSLEILDRPTPIHVVFRPFLPAPLLNLARLFEKLDCFQKSPRKSAHETGAVGVPKPVLRLMLPPLAVFSVSCIKRIAIDTLQEIKDGHDVTNCHLATTKAGHSRMRILVICTFTLFAIAFLLVAATITLAPAPSGGCTLGICL